MTPQEIEAQADALQQLLVAHGVTPEAALTEEGRERARPRFQQAMDRAQKYGYRELAERINGMVEAEAQRHARRGIKRSGGIGSDAVAAPAAQAPAAAPARPPVVAPPLPVPGSPSPMPMAPPAPGAAPPLPSADSLFQGVQNMGPPMAPAQAPAMPANPNPLMAATLTGREGGPQPMPQAPLLGPIDYGMPETDIMPPSDRGAERGPLPDWFSRGRPSENMVARPLRPQSALEEIDQQAVNRNLLTGYQTGGDLATIGLSGPVIGHVARTAPAVGRGVAALAAPGARTIARNPLASGAAVAGGTTLAATAQPQDIPAPSAEDRATMQSLQSELGGWQDRLKELQAQRKTTMEEMQAERAGKGKSGKGPGTGLMYQQQLDAVTRIDRQIDSINTSITTTNDGITQARNRMSPEYRMKLERDKLEADERDRVRRSGMTTRELASDYLGYLPAVTIPAAGVLGGALRARALSTWNRQIGEVEKAWGKAVQRARTARPGSPAFNQAAAESERHLSDFTRLQTAGAGHGGGMGAGAATNFLAATLPEEIDVARAALGSPLWDKLKEEVYRDIPTALTYAGRVGATTAAGAAAGHLGGYPVNVLPLNRGAPRGYAAETLGLRERTGTPRAASTPQSPTPPSGPIAPPGGAATQPTTPPLGPGSPPRTGPDNALARLGGQRRADEPLESSPPPAPRGVRQSEGPPAGAEWNPRTQRWHLRGQMIGGPDRWPPPVRRDWRDYPE